MTETGNAFPESFNPHILDSGFRRRAARLHFDAIALSSTGDKIAAWRLAMTTTKHGRCCPPTGQRVAIVLVKALGIKAQFWINSRSRYRTILAYARDLVGCLQSSHGIPSRGFQI